jgi:C-methyltransferase C-terminal domain/Putative zinc binding domain/Methyltransferase domain
MPLANRFLRPDQAADEEPAFPLRLAVCPVCGHVQLADHVAPALMFEDYLYVSSASDTLRMHLQDLADVVADIRALGPTDLVVDVGANDGTLLKAFAAHGVRTLGVDPAVNLAQLAAGDGIDRYTGFFTASSAGEIVERWGHAAVITATNTFPHIPDLHDFMMGIDTALAPGGAFVLEAHYLVDLLDKLAFDTVYHEHVSYWALGPMERLFAEHGMQAVRAERLPIHHGQLRVVVQRQGEAEVDGSVREILELERERAVGEPRTWCEYADRVRDLRRAVRQTVDELRAAGKRMTGYGAPAKGSTLLSYLGLGPCDVAWIADRSPLKQGRLTPGSHIPIVEPERLEVERPDAVLLLAWNFADEILDQQHEYVAGGGRFLVPVPEVHWLPAEVPT